MEHSQKKWKLTPSELMHAESGYCWPKPDGSIEVGIVQSTGLLEVYVLSSSFILSLL